MKIKKIRNNQTVIVYGVEFHGFEELKKRAFSNDPKEGIYVGCDCERYPCLIVRIMLQRIVFIGILCLPEINKNWIRK